jgi:hypothetical protein
MGVRWKTPYACLWGNHSFLVAQLFVKFASPMTYKKCFNVHGLLFATLLLQTPLFGAFILASIINVSAMSTTLKVPTFAASSCEQRGLFVSHFSPCFCPTLLSHDDIISKILIE